MSVHELNQFMTYVVEGWMLFSAGFISATFIAFVARRIQEDIEAAELSLAEVETNALTEGVVGSQSAEAIPLTQSTPSIEESARLEEVAAVSEKLAKEKEKQSNSSSVSVST